ncbi:MAG: hypothetical protein LBQ18_02010 [Campylobacteraceae bacterium]|jgi:hypothetical protein|nr:hypothetical protein [Campylobacteraceae bacterium]
MKKFFCIAAALALFINTASAQLFDLGEQIRQYQKITQDYDDEEETQSLFLSYESIPPRVYVGEIFPVKIKAIVTRDDYERITTDLADSELFHVINLKSPWEKDQVGEYYTNTFYIRTLNQTSKLPDFTIRLIDGDDDIVEETVLDGGEIEVLSVKGDAKFSHVVAQSLAVKNEATSKFDDKSLIVTLEIEATYSNLKEFEFNNGTANDYKESIQLQSLEYTVIVPNYTKILDFTYFNTVSRDFQSVIVPLNIKNDDVSTHTDLNPKENKFKLYKDILFTILGLLGLIIFAFKRYKSALLASVLFFSYVFYVNNPFNQGIITEETVIRVLPTEKSSIFHITDGNLEIEILSRKDGYVKIMLPSGRIGWVKEDSVIKN